MKKMYFSPVLMLLLLASISGTAQEDYLKKLEEIAVIDQKVLMPMRDGVRLATDIYRPKTEEPDPSFQ